MAVACGSTCFGWSLNADDLPKRVHETGARSAPTLTLYFENDTFADSDRHYTNGVKLSWLSADLATWGQSGWRRSLIQALPFVNRPGATKNLGVSFGQNIYTPQDITRNPPDPADRPYAGWTYLELTFSSRTRTLMDTLSLQVGIIGPHSYAADMQQWFHEWLDNKRPAGWDHQLKDEPGINVVFERKSRLFARTRHNLLGVDLVPHIGVSLGNVQTYANAGALVRAGFNLRDDFGIDLIRAAGGAGPIDGDEARRRRSGAASFFVFGGVDGRAVARDIFLDGNTFVDDGPSVDKESFVSDAFYGAGMVWGRWQLTYTHVSRSREFKTQARGNRFGSVTISRTW